MTRYCIWWAQCLVCGMLTLLKRWWLFLSLSCCVSIHVAVILSSPSPSYLLPQTIGAAFGAKKVSIGGESVTLGIWVSYSLLHVYQLRVWQFLFSLPGYSWIWEVWVDEQNLLQGSKSSNCVFWWAIPHATHVLAILIAAVIHCTCTNTPLPPDLTDQSSFERAKFWVNELKQTEEASSVVSSGMTRWTYSSFLFHLSPPSLSPSPPPSLPPFLQECIVYLCGTKVDLVEENKKARKVDVHVVRDYADGEQVTWSWPELIAVLCLYVEISAKYMETSAKTGYNIGKAGVASGTCCVKSPALPNRANVHDHCRRFCVPQQGDLQARWDACTHTSPPSVFMLSPLPYAETPGSSLRLEQPPPTRKTGKDCAC